LWQILLRLARVQIAESATRSRGRARHRLVWRPRDLRSGADSAGARHESVELAGRSQGDI